MPGSDVTATPAGSTSKLKVFISYSREDQSIAGELVSGLELCGFDSYLDKEDIAPGEPWEERLKRLIRDADTVVFVISPNSIASQHCGWEVQETIKASKRLVPVVWTSVPDTDVPPQLRRLNYIFFSEGNSFSKSLGDLAKALRVNLDWIREHTRLGELAANWEERSRPEGLLLRGSEIAEATTWLAKRPKDAPQITTQQQTFIEASIRAAEEDLRRRAALQWRAKAGTIAAAIIFAIGTAVSTVAWFEANSARVALQASVEDLRGKNLRLNRKIALRVAAYTDVPYFVGPNWYQFATDYSGAIAIVKVSSSRDANIVTDIGTGFIVRGSALYSPWGEQPVFVTAAHVLGSSRGFSVPFAKAYFPGLEDNKDFIGFSELLWSGPKGDWGISVLRIKGSLPFGAKPIEKVRHSEWKDLPFIDVTAPEDGTGAEVKPIRPLASIGFGAEDVGFALFFNNLLGVIAKTDNGAPLQLGYTYVTQPGASGSPVFDVETGELVAVHEMAADPNRKIRVAGGISIVAAIAAIEAELGQPK